MEEELATLRTCVSTLQLDKVRLQERLVESELVYAAIEALKQEKEQLSEELSATVLVLEQMRADQKRSSPYKRP